MLGDKWEEIFFKLKELDEDNLNGVAKKVGIKDYSRQEKFELIENIMKETERKKIIEALRVSRRHIFNNWFAFVSGLASIIALLFYTDMGRDIKKWLSLLIVTVSTTTTTATTSTGKTLVTTTTLPKKPPDTLTLCPDASVYPRDGEKWIEPVTQMKFVWISGGCHGDACVGFWMGEYEVTQGQWKKITGGNPSKVNQGDGNPVQYVSWNDIQNFIKDLNALDDKNKTGKKYRLPKASEWEYACRNASGIKDMEDGVSEWCQDTFHYQGKVYNIIRGISSCDDLKKVVFDYKSWHTGFRLVSCQTN